MLENHHREFFKQTMLKHEDIFRHQVRELHRLYNVQKHLMTTLRNDTKQVTKTIQMTSLDIHDDDLAVHFHLPKAIREGGSIHEDHTVPNDVELTLSIGPSTSTRRSQNCPPRTIDNDARATTKTSSTNSTTLYNQDSKRPHWLFQDLSLNRT